MWWKLFILLVATAVLAASDDDDNGDLSRNCMGLVNLECDPEAKKPDFPGNAEELEDVCKFATEFFDCNDRVLSNCEGGGGQYGRLSRDIGANFRRVCNDDPLLRTAVAAILPCVKENMRRLITCGDSFTLNQNSSYIEAMNELGVAEIEDLDDSGRKCLSIIYDMGCGAATTGLLCGNVSRDIVINIIQGMDAPFNLCPAGVKDKLPELAELIRVEIEKANYVEDNLKKKK